MRKGILLLLMSFGIGGLIGQTTVLNEQFDSDANFTKTSDGFYSDGSGDYFGIYDPSGGTDDFDGGSEPSGVPNYSSFTGNFLIGEDLDGDGTASTQITTWSGLNISGLINLSFSGSFAATTGFDGPDNIIVEVDIDGGGFVNVLAFEADADQSNEYLAVDADFNGQGDGTQLTTTVQNFTRAIAGTGNVLTLRVTYTANSGSEEFGVDDLKIIGTTVSANDADSEVYDPTTQVAAANIASTATTSGTAVDVFRMTIEDQNSGDGLDTKVTNIRIKPHTSNTADWTDHIQGIVIDDGAAFLTPSSVTITDTEIDIAFPATELVVPDAGPATDVTVAIFLNTSNITDNTVFSCFVDGDDHGFTADATGSTFISSFSLGDVVSNDFNIQVEATELQVQTQPSDVVQGDVMSPDFSVAYTDVNGNIDLDYDGLGTTTSVSTTGSFDGAATTTVAASSGIASFSNLVFSAQGVGLTLTASDVSGLLGASVVSNTFDVTAPAVMINPGDIVINEYMANPDCELDSSGEFVELYNTTANAIDIAGWTLEDDGSDSHTFTGANGTTSIPAAGYLILGIAGKGSASPDYDYSSFTLGNGGDEIVLKDGATEICRVDYSNGDPFGAGVSVQLPENYDYSLADDGEILDSEFVEPNTTFGCGDFGTPGAANILPINLLTFTATAKENQTLLQWTTSTELNNDYMAVEHSTNGRDFTEIGRVKGAGTTEQTQNYTFTDTKPANGINFYRLRQVDFDGHTAYHKTVSVMMYGKEGEVRLAPTEVKSQVMLYLPEAIEQAAEIRIYDMSGRLWQSSTLEAGNSQKAFDLAHLSVGQYVLQVVGTQTVSTVRFNKL